jgi:hypothetical protein
MSTAEKPEMTISILPKLNLLSFSAFSGLFSGGSIFKVSGGRAHKPQQGR